MLGMRHPWHALRNAAWQPQSQVTAPCHHFGPRAKARGPIRLSSSAWQLSQRKIAPRYKEFGEKVVGDMGQRLWGIWERKLCSGGQQKHWDCGEGGMPKAG